MSEFAEWWDCTREEYDADTEFVRSSALKEFDDCPSIYEARYIKKPGDHGYMGPKSQSRFMTKGTVGHAFALEGKRDWFTATACRAEIKSGTRKGQECGSDVAAGGMLFDVDEEIFVCGTHKKGRNVKPMPDAITPKEEQAIIGIGEAIRRNADAQDLLKDRFHERAARSIDPDTGVKKKALIDIIKPSPFIIGDMKTTEMFNTESIWRKIDENGWLLSFAHYESVIMDIQAAHGKPVHWPAWVVLIVESIPPFRVKVWTFDEQRQEASRIEYRQLLAEFAECQRNGVWPQKDIDETEPQWFGYRHGYQQQGSM